MNPLDSPSFMSMVNSAIFCFVMSLSAGSLTLLVLPAYRWLATVWFIIAAAAVIAPLILGYLYTRVKP